jgi:hypothetical protein
MLLCAVFANAQSGRRQQRVEPAAPIPTPTPEPTPAPKTENQKSDVLIFVGVDKNGGFSTYPYSYYDAVVAGCTEELRKNTSASVDSTAKNLNRNDAINKAKNDTKTYVVYLQLREPMSTSSAQSADQLEVEYTVFAPQTAKVVISGTSFQNARRAGPVVVGPTGTGSSSVLYREELLRRAAQDAGQRIIKSLHLNDPRAN